MFDCGERLTQLRLGRSAEHTHRRPSMQIGPPAKRQRLRRLERNQRIDGTIGGDSGQFRGGGRRDQNRRSLIDPPLAVVPLVVREREHSVGFAGLTDPCRRPRLREGCLRIGACDLVEGFPHGSDVVPVLGEGPPRRSSPSRVDERVLLHGGDRADVDLRTGDDLALGCDQFVVTAFEHIERWQLDSRPTGKIVTPLGLAADDQRRPDRSVEDGLDRPIDERLLGNPDLVGDGLRIGSIDGMGHSASGVGEHRQALRDQHQIDHRGDRFAAGVDDCSTSRLTHECGTVDTLTGLGRPLLRRRHPDGDGIRPGEILREDHHQAGRVRSNRSVAWEYQLPA